MAEETTQPKTEETKAPAAKPAAASSGAPKQDARQNNNRGGRGQRGGQRGRGGRGGRRGRRPEREKPEFDQTIVALDRVTRVTKGGKRLSFRCTMVIGDRKGRVGYGVAKGADVQLAIEKAVRQAKKRMITVPIVNETIPFRVDVKAKAAKIMVKPARKGTGVIAGGALRTVFEYAGIPNISSKTLGTKNKLSNVKAAFKALEELAIAKK